MGLFFLLGLGLIIPIERYVVGGFFLLFGSASIVFSRGIALKGVAYYKWLNGYLRTPVPSLFQFRVLYVILGTIFLMFGLGVVLGILKVKGVP